ncbi:hypothetical protein N9M66_01125 [Litoreibacter sp.]|nr:hypothetical protein [Litoreibacter sp.]
MTFNEAMAQQPAWVGIWLNVLLLGAFILPLALLIWKQSRKAGLMTLATSLIAGFAIDRLYYAMGYVRLLGLPHVLLWTPLVVFLYSQSKRADMPVWPSRIIWAVIATLLISLAFDYVDVIRYGLGERTPTILPPQG